MAWMDSIADLHVHSCFSDGTMTPAELLDAAAARGVGLLALTDHDLLEGARALRDLPGKRGVSCVSGVELDAMDFGLNFHILGYGVDLDDPGFQAFCRENRERLEEVNRRLIVKMERAGEPVSLAEYEAFAYEPTLGGWTALHYFLSKGLTEKLAGGLSVYGKYSHSYTCVGFPPISEVSGRIHAAGGLAVLAHPGEVIPREDMAAFRAAVLSAMAQGLDGIECHYPFHPPEVTELCLALCREHGWLVTCGSDCHGGFGHSRVGELPVTVGSLPGIERIAHLIEKGLPE